MRPDEPERPDGEDPGASTEDLVPTEVTRRPRSGGSGTPDSAPGSERPRPGPVDDAGADGLVDPWAVVPAGRRIGPYRIVELLGRGGMGRVYLAEQEEPLRREVALKIVRASLADGSLRDRFAAEQKALARMNHPYVAQVFDSGTTEAGQPWFVMERVDGLDVATYCDEERFGLRARLRLFCEVCEGVQHAHQKGIIHRDLKPSNILVTEVEGRPVPKVIDFGVAKGLDQPLRDETLTSQWMVDTRGYLSPESVVRGRDQDTRSDVYNLGLVLFELLAGTLPFPTDEDDSLLAMLRRIAERDAPTLVERFDALDPEQRAEIARHRGLSSPSALRRGLAGDLTWIVARALAREKDDRYPSAASLAEDVRRHLDDLPVDAGPPGTLRRLTKLVRRHRVAVAAGSLVVASLAWGFVARTLEAERANREAARANLEAERAAREAATAAAVTRFLIDLFEVNEPDRGRGDLIDARELLDKGAETIRSSLEDEPLVRAAILDTVGSLKNALGEAGEAEELILEGLDLRRRHLPPLAPEIAQSLHHLTMVRIEQGRFHAAEESARELVEIRDRPGTDPTRLADALNQRAIVLHNLARLEESERWQERAIELLERESLFEDPAWHVALNHLGTLYLDTGRFAEAQVTLRRALEAREREAGPDSDSTAQTLNNLGLALSQTDRFDEAAETLQRALAIREARLGPDHPNLVWGLRILGLVELERERVGPAELLVERGLAIQEKALGRRHPFTALSLEALARVRTLQGRLGEAEELAREALSIAEERLEPDHMVFGYYLHTLANVLRDADRFAEARRAYDEAEDRMSRALGAGHPDLQEIEADRRRLEERAAAEPGPAS